MVLMAVAMISTLEKTVMSILLITTGFPRLLTPWNKTLRFAQKLSWELDNALVTLVASWA